VVRPELAGGFAVRRPQEYQWQLAVATPQAIIGTCRRLLPRKMRCSAKASPADFLTPKLGVRQRGRLRTRTFVATNSIRERINELKEASSRKATLSREQTIDWLCNVISVSAATIEANSSLVQTAEFVDGKPVKLKIPDKIAAVRELVKICGWAQPDRVESTRDTLADFIDSIRNAPRRPGMAAYAEDNGGQR
jgi:hypothetical protein